MQRWRKPAPRRSPTIACLLSDVSADVNGQVVRIEGSRLSLVAHPAVLLPLIQREGGWTVEAIREAFDGPFAGRLPPVGFTGVNVAGYAMPASIWSKDRDE